MPLPMTSRSIPFFSTSSRSAGCTPGECWGGRSKTMCEHRHRCWRGKHPSVLSSLLLFLNCVYYVSIYNPVHAYMCVFCEYCDSGSTHVGPSLSPVPGPTASWPDLTVLVAGGASLHLHVAPGERGDLWRGHVT